MPEMMRAGADVDLVVVGSGVAGLSAALSARRSGHSVVVLTKAAVSESNTHYAQGGIAAPVGDADSPQLHFEDTIGCGAGLNDWTQVRVLTAEAVSSIEELVGWGAGFDLDGHRLALGREAAHSSSRIIHSGDATGLAVQRALMAAVRRSGINVVENARVTRLVVDGHRVTAVEYLSGRERRHLPGRNVLLATGGAGRIYSRTTNPPIATGDGLALAFEAGAQLVDLEFFQFHPTALAIPAARAFLISEAVRGEGGTLRNRAKETFLRRYHPDAELAPRDVVSRAIWTEMQSDDADHVYLDLTHLGADGAARFPTIYSECRRYGVDPTVDLVPVAPAAHYLMGGIRADMDGRTTLPGLLAAGEVAGTGVHGANRLASNSLLEGLVAGRRCGLALDRDSTLEPASVERSPHRPFATQGGPDSLDELRRWNWADLGLIRSEPGLLRAAAAAVPDGVAGQGTQYSNALLLRKLMGTAGLLREESRGAHFRSDFPTVSPRWRGRIVMQSDGDGILQGFLPVSAPLPQMAPA